MKGLDADKLILIHTDNIEDLHNCGLLMFNSETTGVLSGKFWKTFKTYSNEVERNNKVHFWQIVS